MLQHVQTLQKQQSEVTKRLGHDSAADLLVNVVVLQYSVKRLS